MAFTQVTAGTEALIEDLNQIIKALLGTAGYEQAWKLISASGEEFIIKLSDASGAREFQIQDSAGTEVASIDSDGNLEISGSFTPGGALILPTSATPSQTTEGSVSWDSDDDLPTVGTGAATKYIGLSRGAGQAATATRELAYDTTLKQFKVWDGSASIGVGWQLVAYDETEATMTSATAADMVVVATPNIPATTPVLIVTQFRKSANAFQPSIGLKVNSADILTATLSSQDKLGGFANTAEAQDGVSVLYIGPRRTNYVNGLSGFYRSAGVTSGVASLIGNATNVVDPLPIAEITSITITGDSDGTNTLGVQGVYVYIGR